MRNTILEQARSALREVGYQVIDLRQAKADLYFEDSNVLGFIWITESVGDILSDWQAAQDDFLTANAPGLRASGGKAWNVYSVFLTAAECTDTGARELAYIEEDFRATRKVARAGLKTRSDVLSALWPLLPLQNWTTLHDANVLPRLRTRLALPDRVLEALFEDRTTSDMLAALLEEQ